MKERQLSKAGIVAGSLHAGVAKSDITVRAEGITVKDPLYAEALVLDDGTRKLAIIAMDVVAIGGIGDVRDDFLAKLRSRIQKELKIRSARCWA